MSKLNFSVKFWGTRGAVSSPTRESVKYGGNTSCLEVQCGDRILILDAGSGFRLLGLDLQTRKIANLDLFFTHFHYDHICGLPFFAPLYNPDCKMRIWSGHLDRKNATRESIKDYMVHPFFPVGPEVFKAQISYNDFRSGDELSPGDNIEIKTCKLNHPGGATAYRVNFDGRSFCYVTDTEHKPDGLDANILQLIDGADMMVYDATYADSEYPNYIDFGHSTWEQGIRLCQKANVKKFGLFHHRPSRTDEKLDSITREAKAIFSGSFATSDGLKIKL